MVFEKGAFPHLFILITGPSTTLCSALFRGSKLPIGHSKVCALNGPLRALRTIVSHSEGKWVYLDNFLIITMFCPDDRDFLMAGRTEHENDRRGDRVHQQRQSEEERKQDLESFQKILDKSLNFNLKF